MALSQSRLLELSSNAKQVFAYQSKAAYVQLDEPHLVIEAIREVYDQSHPSAPQAQQSQQPQAARGC
jgi:hypothetical protein